MSDRLSNPYAGCRPGRGAWIRGNLHGHSSEHSACSSVPLAAGIERYRCAGAGFMAVTDHDHVTDLADARSRHPGMVFLEGFEHSRAENVLFIGERVPALHRLPLTAALAAADGLLTIVCHPRPRVDDDYWTVAKIQSLSPAPVGIEVYNGHYAGPHPLFKRTNPLYTDTWDALLSRGVRMWGFANDDFHDPPDFGRAWNMAWVDSLTSSGVLEALRSGHTYGTTGLLLDSVEVTGAELRVRLASPAQGRWIGPGARALSCEYGVEFTLLHRGEAYLRFEAEGAAGRLWLQPFFPAEP